MSINNPGTSSGIGVSPSPDIGISTQDINLIGTTALLLGGGVGLNILKQALGAVLVYGTATAAGATTIAGAPANRNIRKLVLDITENATLASAGENVITIALNGVTIYETQVYIPAAALSSAGQLVHIDLDFSTVSFNAGASGTLTATLGTALATGALVVNAYFD